MLSKDDRLFSCRSESLPWVAKPSMTREAEKGFNRKKSWNQTAYA